MVEIIKMDWIQIYYLVLMVMSGTLNLFKHGESQGDYNFWYWIVAMIFGSPIIGRVFGWW